ncbi:MAG: hypothetical protein M1819_005152 [Sarea resinae]|nr:MAG: hypothetical protein M1819_005152 [Sarea resinae]
MATDAQEIPGARPGQNASSQGPISQGLKLVNRLNESRSPYVRGHMNNPVAWQMWGPEALGLAKKWNKLLFVSIGYAACHWCHVMERESFMSNEIAAVLNSSFIPIKVDREERPDIDRIYMNYVQATTGSGGWPLNVFLTPDLEPVFGGTYWPGPNSSTVMGNEHVGFLEILEKMRDVWNGQEERCLSSAKEITAQLKEFAAEGTMSSGAKAEDDGDGIDIDLLEEAYQHFVGRYDKAHAGFGVAQKFPTPVNLYFLLRLGQFPSAVEDVVGAAECEHAALMAINTLRSMARGGIHDHIGNGFARYSVTRDWSLPHFEKMLYDQAQLLNVYLDAFLASKDPEMLGAVYDIATYLTDSPLTSPNGGFFSAEDADSYYRPGDTEKREGAFYVWTLKDLQTILGERNAEVCARFWGVSAHGNVSPEHDAHDEFINQNVLAVKSTPAVLSKEFGLGVDEVVGILKEGRRKLREHRERERPRPNLDDKIIVAWNGLAVGALARVSAVLEEVDPDKSRVYRDSAEKAVAFIRRELYDETTGLLKRIYREGPGEAPAFADDYAFLIQGLIELYEATFNDVYLEFADKLQKTQLSLFWDTPHHTTPSTGGGFFSTPASQPDLLLRLKDGMDNAEPSTNGISAQNLFRLSSLLEDPLYAARAKETIAAFAPEVLQHPSLFVSILQAVVGAECGVRCTIVCGNEDEDGDGANYRGEGGERQERAKLVKDKLRAWKAEATEKPSVLVRLDPARRRECEWLRARNSVLSAMEIDERRILVCERGVCSEEGVDLGGLSEALNAVGGEQPMDVDGLEKSDAR